MLKVMVACGCGMGTSQIMKTRAQQVLKELGLEATIHHTSLDEAQSIDNDFDLIIISEAFVKNFKVREKTKVVGLKNLLSKAELKEKIQALGICE